VNDPGFFNVAILPILKRMPPAKLQVGRKRRRATRSAQGLPLPGAVLELKVPCTRTMSLHHVSAPNLFAWAVVHAIARDFHLPAQHAMRTSH
jgi:hypothetical protein